MRTLMLLTTMAVLGLATAAHAASATNPTIGGTNVSNDITTDTTWSAANDPYYLRNPIIVKNGAKLTIEAGVTVITFSDNDGGLVITRGSQIFANGTADAPIIMTSAEDVATWTGTTVTRGQSDANGNGTIESPDEDNEVIDITALGDRTTGQWRDVVQEWRTLTVLGPAVLSASEFDGSPVNDPDTGSPNPTVVDGTASKIMEGLASPGDGTPQEIAYGGGDDDDDSGVIAYVSTRYTGRVLGEGDELNAISMGGIGRETDVHHLDLINNVDDGVETWGGTVNYKYVNVWNIGDDSFDIDQGWRGKAQFGLLVQGFATPDAPKQGGGAGDNIFEHDGAEQSDVQPRTTGVIYNFTAIGEPNSGDGGTTWRDNARMQYRNCIFMDIGDELIRMDNADGDGGLGYKHNNTHSWTSIWTTPYTTLPTVNAGTSPYAPADLYTAQTSGNLAEIRCTIIYPSSTTLFDDEDEFGGTGAETNIVAPDISVFNPSASGGPNGNVLTDVLPVAHMVRENDADTPAGNSIYSATIDGKLYENIKELDPRPVQAVLIDCYPAPKDGFFTPANYPGAFSPSHNWARGWTAADAYGFFVDAADKGANPAVQDPGETIALGSARITWQSVEGVYYTVYESDDNVTFTPMTTVKGDGSMMSVADLEDFQSGKFYDVRIQ